MEFAKGYDVHKDPRMINCKTQCGNVKCPYKNYECWAEKSCVNYKPPICLSNADRIRAMSDEELAEFLSKTQGDIFRGEMRLTFQWLEWLQQEVE